MRLRPLVALTAVALLAGACFDLKPSDDAPGITDRQPALALGPSDVQIVTRDGDFEMALVGTDVVMRFSDQAIAKMSRDLGPQSQQASGVGGWIERTVKGNVQKMLNKQMMIPVSTIDEARYEDGEIRLLSKSDKGRFEFFSSHKDGSKSVMKGFAPADAERFVAAVNAAKSRY